MAKTPKITPEEQMELRMRAKKELQRISHINADEETLRMVQNFTTKFSHCEILYKVILQEHQFRKTGQRPDRMQITMTQVPYALDFAGYDFDKSLLEKIFGSSDKVGSRSAKKLRDALAHSMSSRAVAELTAREQELHGYMDAFLHKIEFFDAA